MPENNKCRFLTKFLIVIFILISCGTDSEKKPSWKIIEGDIPGMHLLENNTDDYLVDKKKRLLRVLVSYNYTNYFVVEGKQKGLEYELMKNFEKFLNRGRVDANKEVQLIFISVPDTSPPATIVPSATATIALRLSIPALFSILAIIGIFTPLSSR